MSEKTIKIAIVVLVAVALAAVGAYFILSKTDDSLAGNYELKEGVYATMDKDEHIEFNHTFDDKNLRIEKMDDCRFTISWIGTTLYSIIEAGYITTTGFVNIDGTEYVAQGGGSYKDCVLFLTAMCIDSSGKICAFNAVFVKSGSNKSASLHDYIAKDDEYHSSSAFESINGEFKDITDTEKMSFDVLKSDKGICILQFTFTTPEGTITYKSLGVVASNRYYYLCNTYYENEWINYMKIYNDHITILFNGLLDGGENYAGTYTLVKDAPYTPGSEFDSLSGLTFSGTARIIDNNKSLTEVDASLTFGKVNRNIVEAVFKIGDYSSSELVQILKGNDERWNVFFRSDIGNGYTVTKVLGFFSKDLKTLTLETGSIKLHNSCASSIIIMTQSGGSESVGFYYPASTMDAVIEDQAKTVDVEWFVLPATSFALKPNTV